MTKNDYELLALHLYPDAEQAGYQGKTPDGSILVHVFWGEEHYNKKRVLLIKPKSVIAISLKSYQPKEDFTEKANLWLKENNLTLPVQNSPAANANTKAKNK